MEEFGKLCLFSFIYREHVLFNLVYRDGEGGRDRTVLLHRPVQQEAPARPGCV